MKKAVSFFLSLLLFLSCNNKECKQAGNQGPLVNELNSFLDEWHKAAAEADFNGYFDKIAEDGIYIGTDVPRGGANRNISSMQNHILIKGTSGFSFPKTVHSLLQMDAAMHGLMSCWTRGWVFAGVPGYWKKQAKAGK